MVKIKTMKIKEISKKIVYLNAGLPWLVPGKTDPSQYTLDDVVVALNTVINILFGAAGTVAIIFIIIGGYLYITSHGSQEQTQKAKTTIFWAIGGLVLVISAYAIVRLLMKFLLNDDSFGQIVR